MYSEDEVRLRHKRLWKILIFGCAWSFIYTAISLTLMVSQIHRVDQVCTSRKAAVSAVRQGFERSDGWSSDDQIWLDKNLPVLRSC